MAKTDFGSAWKAGALLREQTRDASEKQAAELFTRGIEALVEAIKNHTDVHDEVVKYRAYFELVHRMVERLTFWKRLHDQLHNVERDCFRPLLKFSSRFPDEQTMIELKNANLTSATR